MIRKRCKESIDQFIDVEKMMSKLWFRAVPLPDQERGGEKSTNVIPSLDFENIPLGKRNKFRNDLKRIVERRSSFPKDETKDCFEEEVSI